MPIDQGKLPVAEIFDSIQGEGFWVGTPMRFVRLAGCPVGKKASKDFYEIHPTIASSPTFQKQSACQTWDGRFFPCDTDFSCHSYMGVDEMLGDMVQQHVCLTGGEPLIHQKRLIELGFFQQVFAKRTQVHIETSGTIMLHPSLQYDSRVWITVSPKAGFLPEMISNFANEVKLLVDENFDESKFTCMPSPQANVYVSPINDEKTVNQENVQRALKILGNHPEWRLSCQWHKFLNLR